MRGGLIQTPQMQYKIFWKKEVFIPDNKIDEMLYSIALWRYEFLNNYYKDAEGNIEKDFIPQRALDFLLYLPRGLFIGFFYQTPNFWFKEGGTTGGTIARYTVHFDILWVGILGLVFAWKSLNHKQAFLLILVLCLMYIFLHIITEPNVGQIVRKRHVFICILLAFSYAYYVGRFFL